MMLVQGESMLTNDLPELGKWLTSLISGLKEPVVRGPVSISAGLISLDSFIRTARREGMDQLQAAIFDSADDSIRLGASGRTRWPLDESLFSLRELITEQLALDHPPRGIS